MASSARKKNVAGVYVLKLKSGDCYYVGSSQNISQRVENHIFDPQVKWIVDHGGVAEVLDPVTPPEDSIYAWEMRETLARMIMHFPNSVRGWEYCSAEPLSNSDIDGIFKLMCGGLSVPLCHKCGFSGHLSSACTTQRRATWLDNLMSCRHIEKKKVTVTGSDVILKLINDAQQPHQAAATVPVVKRKNKFTDEVPFLPPPPQVPPQEPLRFMTYSEICEQQEQPAAKKYHTNNNNQQFKYGCCQRCGRSCHSAEGCYARTTVDGKQIITDSAASGSSAAADM